MNSRSVRQPKNDVQTRVTVLGARGSVPVSGKEFRRYGGATTCFLAELGGFSVVLDAGTGLLRLPENVLAVKELPLLLTHPHTDHLLGLPMCAYVMQPGSKLTVYGARRSGLDVRSQLGCLMRTPLWPVPADGLPAEIAFEALPEDFTIGPVHVRSIEGIHPGGVSLIRLERDGTSVVLITDCTLTDALWPHALDFARGADLLLIDGQYSEEEWAAHSSFGHNTWLRAAEFGRASGAREVRIVHHAPTHSDVVLDAASSSLSAIHPRCSFAREGEVILL